MSINQANIQPVKLSNSQVKWSQSKYIEMQKKLDGYWAEDTWNPNENPFKDKTAPRGVYIYFASLSKIIRFSTKAESIKPTNFKMRVFTLFD